MKRPRFILPREERLRISLGLGLAGGAVLAAALGWLVRKVIWKAHAGLDRDVTLAIRKIHTPVGDRAARVVTQLASHYVLIPGTLGVSLALVRARHQVSAVLFSGSVLGGFLLCSVLKISFRRARPELWPALVTEESYSFPSGHATSATVFYGGLAAVAWHLSPSPVVRTAALGGAAGLVSVIGFSRVYLGAHWTSDVVGGTLLGLLWEAFCFTATELVAGHFELDTPRRLAAA
jgi:membrane-associated phospholipid phosphatase